MPWFKWMQLKKTNRNHWLSEYVDCLVLTISFDHLLKLWQRTLDKSGWYEYLKVHQWLTLVAKVKVLFLNFVKSCVIGLGAVHLGGSLSSLVATIASTCLAPGADSIEFTINTNEF